MEKISDSFYTESEKKRLRRLARQMMDQKAEEKKITELIKGSKTELVCYTGERIEILIPFVYTSKDFYRKLQYLIGHCALMKQEFSRWSEYHIPLYFEIVAEESLPEEVKRAIDALNQGEERI